MNQLKTGKAPGECGICAEMHKTGGAAALLCLHILFCTIWSTGIILTIWKPGVVLPIWKENGDT